MTETPQNGLSLRRRWMRSPRFRYSIFLLCLVVAGLAQAYQYWWGVQIERILGGNVGAIQRMPLFPASWKSRIDPKYLEPLEPITEVRLTGSVTSRHTSIVETEHIRMLKSLNSLKRLQIYGPLETDGWKPLSELRQLKSLGLFSETPDSVFQSIAKLKRLEELSVIIRHTSPSAISQLAELPRLKRLNLNIEFSIPMGGTMSDKSLIEAQMREFAKLDSLQILEAPFINDRHILALCSLLPNGRTPFIKLSELRLDSSKITNAGLVQLDNIQNLVHLDLSRSEIDDDGLEILKSLPNLRTLYLSGCRSITDRGAECLAQMPRLESLNVADTGITCNGLFKLGALKQLRVLRLSSHNQVSPELRRQFPPTCKFITR